MIGAPAGRDFTRRRGSVPFLTSIRSRIEATFPPRPPYLEGPSSLSQMANDERSQLYHLLSPFQSSRTFARSIITWIAHAAQRRFRAILLPGALIFAQMNVFFPPYITWWKGGLSSSRLQTKRPTIDEPPQLLVSMSPRGP